MAIHKKYCPIQRSAYAKYRQPLIDIETVVNLISSTTTEAGLKATCQVDKNKYELKRKVSDEEFDKINLFLCEILGNWNYAIKPNVKLK